MAFIELHLLTFNQGGPRNLSISRVRILDILEDESIYLDIAVQFRISKTENIQNDLVYLNHIFIGNFFILKLWKGRHIITQADFNTALRCLMQHSLTIPTLVEDK